MKLYRVFGILIDFFIVVFIMAIGGEILKIFVNDVNELFSSPISWILLAVVSMILAGWFFGNLKNDNTLGKKISKIIFKNK